MDIIIKQIGGQDIGEANIKSIIYDILSSLGFDDVHINIVHFGNQNSLGLHIWNQKQEK